MCKLMKQPRGYRVISYVNVVEEAVVDIREVFSFGESLAPNCSIMMVK